MNDIISKVRSTRLRSKIDELVSGYKMDSFKDPLIFRSFIATYTISYCKRTNFSKSFVKSILKRLWTVFLEIFY